MARVHRAMAVLGVSAALTSAGCASQLLITSRPTGAEVIIDDEYILGETPIVLKEQAWWVTKPGRPNHTLTFKLDGYETATREVQARPRIANFVTLGVCFPFLWFMWPIGLLGRYPEDVIVELVPEQEGSAWLEREDDASVIDFTP
ncbi:MAG: PEGA domain-containing protein [Myxococcota bacterium]